MRVGMNYPWPWNAYGTYFGEPTFGAWVERLDENLERLRDLGVDLVRIFLLGNAWAIGRLDAGRFVSGGLPSAASDQFEGMLRAFEAKGMQVLPSLLDFKAVMGPPGRNGYGGRAALLTEASLRTDFLANVLGPLLTCSEAKRGAVFAWEAMNEPVWTMLNPLSPLRCAVPKFLREATSAIEARGFASTVGHRFASDLKTLPTGSVRQCHYYPQRGWRAMLPLTEQPLAPFASTRAILGEFSVRGDTSQGDNWPELEEALQRDPSQRVLERLRAADAKGYEVALIWPDLDGAPFGAADPLKLSAEVQEGMRRYTQHTETTKEVRRS